VGACLALLLLIMGLGVAGLFSSGPSAQPPGIPCADPIFVEAAGDVPHPGVYAFCAPPVKASALAARAGVKSHDRAAWFPADAHLDSGARVVFSGSSEEEKTYRIEEMAPFYLFTLGMPIPVNRSSLEGLTALPGIGPGLARAMVAYREQADGFDRPEDILRVQGIGNRTLERLKPYITVH